jgi:E3 ubiquitin-protein ligase TRIP12
MTDSRRNSASLLARQLRLRLVGEGNDIPRSCTNITVSIHAIATFQALHDYLRPRVSSQGLPPNSRIAGKLAAFAAAVGLPPGVLQRPSNSVTDQSTGGSSAKDASSNKVPGTIDVGSSGEVAQTNDEPSTSESDKGPRRSRRLSARSGRGSTPSPPQTSVPETKTPSTSGPHAQPKVEAMETMDLDDSYMDADVDPEVAFPHDPH